MDEYLNELIAYLVIGTVGVFLLVMASIAVRRRLAIQRSKRRHRRSDARLPDRPTMVVVPDEPLMPEPVVAESEEVHALEFFSAFEDRLAGIRAEIEALDTGALR